MTAAPPRVPEAGETGLRLFGLALELFGGQAEDLFAGMLDGHLAEVMASRTGSGLADAIYRQLIRGV